MARTKSVLLRLTEAEHARLKELAGREPISAYLRRMALGEDDGPRTPEATQTLKDSWVSKALRAQMFEPPEITSRTTNIPTTPTRWFCAECNKLSTVPRCASNPTHKVTPA